MSKENETKEVPELRDNKVVVMMMIVMTVIMVLRAEVI
jgi:hypothetical protein